MSYLSPSASTTQHGVVQIGSNIDVTAPGIISLSQDLSPTGTPTFNTISITTSGTVAGASIVTSVTPTAGTGIGLSAVTTSGPAAAFTVTNTGVTSLIAGTGITVSGSTGAVTVSASAGAVLTTVLVTTNYTALASDEYIGTSSIVPITITLPVGIDGTVYIIKDELGLTFGGVTIQGTGGELIDGALTTSLSIAYSSVTLLFRGTEWHII